MVLRRELMNGSEIEAKAELHSAVGGQHPTVGAERSGRQVAAEVERAVVEANRIGEVVHFAGKLQFHFLVKIPGL